MSGFGRRTLAIVCLATAAGVPLVAFGWAAVRLAELHVRTPWLDVHMGSLTAARPLGQGFRCQTDGLRRIDVRMLATEPRHVAVPIELVLHADTPNGPELRRATFDPDRDHDRLRGSWISFEFQQLTDSAGRAYWFELLPGSGAEHHYSGPWVRFRAQTGERRRWGAGSLEGATGAASFQSHLPDLSAIAVAVEHVAADARLALDVVDEETDALVRHVDVSPGEVRRGWVLLPFDTIEESYARRYRLALTVAGSAVVRSHDGALAFQSFHGRHDADPDVLGMTLGGERLVDRDLFFRTFTSPSATAIEHRLVHRAGWRLVVAGLAWLASVAVTALLVTNAFTPRNSDRERLSP